MIYLADRLKGVSNFENANRLAGLRKRMANELKGSTVSVPELVEQWRGGDQDAATALYNRYQSRLLLLVSGHLNEKLRRRLDAEELVQSIMKSAFRVTYEKDIGCQDETGFWKWLVTVALNKTFKRIERETAQIRDPKREVGGDTVLGERILSEPTPDDVVEVSELLQKILAKLNEVQGKMLLGKLNGLSQAEIAADLGVHPKTVQRNGQVIRNAAKAVLGTDVPEWLIDEDRLTAEEFTECLSEPVSKWLPEKSPRVPVSTKTLKLIELFQQAQPDQSALDGIRSIAKRRSADEKCETPEPFCAAIYLLAIATARVKLGVNLSSDSDSKFEMRAEMLLKEAWIGQAASKVFEQFLKILSTSRE